ncbi:MAG: RNA pseudouridine synthase, partial [Clostridia bacterium]|nr:RNA pseudouridine synthase [Clostridia bacterium]
MKEIELVATEEVNGFRIDKAVSLVYEELSRSSVQNLLEEKKVLLNGKTAKKSETVKTGDVLKIEIPEPRQLSLEPQNIPLEIPYEDEYLLVVNKPKGMVVHPAAGNYDKTLVNALLYHCGDSLSGINGVIRPGIVHRIDKDTSGLLVVAKTDAAHIGLAEQIKDHSFKREYRTVIVGNIKDDKGTINLPIGRHP